jgi:hypothetical protein
MSLLRSSYGIRNNLTVMFCFTLILHNCSQFTLISHPYTLFGIYYTHTQKKNNNNKSSWLRQFEPFLLDNEIRLYL